MNSIRNNHAFRALWIVVTMLGWLALSQRCALGQMLKPAQTAAIQHACCKNGEKPPLKTPADGTRSELCCQTLSVLVPDGVKIPFTSAEELMWLPFDWVAAVVQLEPKDIAISFETRPPPDASTFAELVLHRSLLAHAPPHLS